jgi:hypothetical protein
MRLAIRRFTPNPQARTARFLWTPTVNPTGIIQAVKLFDHHFPQ